MYEQLGVDSELLLLPFVSRGKVCYLAIPQRNGDIRFSIMSEYDAFAPSKETLAKYGLKFAGEINRQNKGRSQSKVSALMTDEKGFIIHIELTPQIAFSPGMVIESFCDQQLKRCA
ncbi:MAG: hypothetical protein H7X92_13900 [Chitinophagales bacterium]|nr:hypothetical protein [Hyphomicrobiales bacterium]